MNAVDKQILSNIDFKITPCLEFAAAMYAVAQKDIIFDMARDMNYTISKKDAALLEKLENSVSKYIRSEMDFFYSICNIAVIVAAFVADYEGIDTVHKFLDTFEKADPIVIFKYLGGIFLMQEYSGLNNQWDEVKYDLNNMKAYIESLQLENLISKEKLLDCFINAEETKDRLHFLFKQFYLRSYLSIENTVLEEIRSEEGRYRKLLEASPRGFVSKYFLNFFKIEAESWGYKFDIHLSLFYNIGFWTINMHDYKEKKGLVVLGLRIYDFYYQKEASDRVDRFLKVLSDKRRIDIIKMLSYKPYYGYEIAAKLGLTPATVNYHINLLMDADIITFDREENKVYYTLNKAKFKELLKDTSLMLINEPLQ